MAFEWERVSCNNNNNNNNNRPLVSFETNPDPKKELFSSLGFGFGFSFGGKGGGMVGDIEL